MIHLTTPSFDGDGHWVEFSASIQDFVRDIGGPALADEFARTRVVKDYNSGSLGMESRPTTEARRDSWINRATFWGFSTKNTAARYALSAPPASPVRACSCVLMTHFNAQPANNHEMPTGSTNTANINRRWSVLSRG